MNLNSQLNSMNYIELINQFWMKDRERPFAASDTRLYFHLLNTCNALGWKNPFGHSDRYLAFLIGACVNTVRVSKERLIAAGLIEITTPIKPSNSVAGQSLYRILTVSKFDTAINRTVSNFDTESDTVPDTVSDTNNKPNQTKIIERETFVPPTLDEVQKFFLENNYTNAENFFGYYTEGKWIDTKGRPVQNWKQKAISTWFEPANLIKSENNGNKLDKKF